MITVGLFLSATPSNGGMFQYSQTIFECLLNLRFERKIKLKVYYFGEYWEPIVKKNIDDCTYVKGNIFGLLLAKLFLLFEIPSSLARALTKLTNPIFSDLYEMDCNIWIFPAQDAISYQLDIRALSSIHDLMHLYEPSFAEVAKGRRLRVRQHRFSNIALHSRGIIVDSTVGKQHVMESFNVPAEKIFLLPYIARKFSGIQFDTKFLDQNYGINRKFLFYPAQFWPHKNHERLIRAAAKSKEKHSDLLLVFTGSLKYEYEKLLKLTEKLGLTNTIKFCGYVSDRDIEAFYQQARALIMPTFFGPTNIPPLEAINHHCPTAVSNIYGMPEQLGDAAIYFNPNSIDSIAETINDLWVDDELCSTLKLNSKKHLQKWNKIEFEKTLFQIIEATNSDIKVS